MAVHLLEGLFFRQSATAEQAWPSMERLLALGSLSAGLTHELNNPAAAAGAGHVVACASGSPEMRHKLGMIAGGAWDRSTLGDADSSCRSGPSSRWRRRPSCRPMEASDREDALSDWLDEHGISGGFELAPARSSEPASTSAWLDSMVAVVGDDTLDGAVRWLNYARSRPSC